MSRPQTVIKEEYKSEYFTFTTDLSDNTVSIEICGQTGERSYEDRSVYFMFGGMTGWFRGEDAIQLGEAMVKHGRRAMVANMVNHQLIHHQRSLKRFVSEGRVERIIMAVVDERPPNYGGGFRTFLIQPIFKKGKAPKYEEDFHYEDNIHWSPFEKEYKKQLSYWGAPVEFRGYDREEELRQFKSLCERQDGPTTARGAKGQDDNYGLDESLATDAIEHGAPAPDSEVVVLRRRIRDLTRALQRSEMQRLAGLPFDEKTHTEDHFQCKACLQILPIEKRCNEDGLLMCAECCGEGG